MPGNQYVLAAIESRALQIDRLYTYRLPPELVGRAGKGSYVALPFGVSNTLYEGVIMDFTDAPDIDESKVKPITNVIESVPPLPDELLNLAVWMKEKYFCTHFDAFNVIVPAALKIKVKEVYRPLTSNAKLLAEARKMSSLCEIVALKFKGRRSGIKKSELTAFVRQMGLSESLDQLMEAGLISLFAETSGSEDERSTIAVPSFDEERFRASKLVSVGTKQSEAMRVLYENGPMPLCDLMYAASCERRTITELASKGVLEFYPAPVPKNVQGSDSGEGLLLNELNQEQQDVYASMKKLMDGTPRAALLYGVTGSGKTHVMLKLIGDCLALGKSSIMLVPEISLTPQTLGIFKAVFGKNVAILHSALTLQERADEYRRISTGEARVVVGTRLAVFSPAVDLGLIIIDEEQEYTYKSERTPKYKTADVAAFRCGQTNAMLVLSSATPSMETYYKALCGKYAFFSIKKRYNTRPLPEVSVIDMREELKEGNGGVLSRELLDRIGQTIHSKKQCILFINRRGYHTFVSCRSCGYVFECPHCSVSMTYHSKNNSMRCHYCGHSEEVPSVCPECGGRQVKYFGFGTQKLESNLAEYFPEARILRMDADTTAYRYAHEEILTKFASGGYDILIGTQMVTKGLNFENVTLVGVLSADSSLYIDDFRAGERTFSLLTQVVGRAGRGSSEGTAVIQTYTPENPIIAYSARQDYDTFAQGELKLRKSLLYPPFCDIALFVVTGVKREFVLEAACRLFENAKSLISGEFSDCKALIFAPSFAKMERMYSKTRARMLMKFRESRRTREFMRKLAEIFRDENKNEFITLSMDINPFDLP